MIERNKLSEKVIKSAVEGDESSIEMVLSHYDSYIKSFTTKEYLIDKPMYDDVKIALIKYILKFTI